MPSLYSFKPRFQACLRPLVVALAARRITPNQVTIAALLLSVMAGAALALAPGTRAPLVAVPIVVLVRMALNAIDGMLAREHAMQTRLGGILNELGDVLADIALYLPLAWLPGIQPAAVVAFVLAGLLAEFAGVVAIAQGGERRYDGPMGKSDRALAVSVVVIGWALGWISPTVAGALFWVAAALALLTLINRVRKSL